MAFTERLTLAIDADVKGAMRELEKVGQGAERELGRAETSAKRLSSQLTTYGAVAVGASAVAARGFYSAAQSAQDLADSVDRANATLGSGKEVQEFASGAAKQFGLSRAAALDLAATFGNVGKAAGLSGSQLSKMSIDLAGRTADLAEQQKLNVDEVQKAIVSGLGGRAKALKAMGVDLDTAAIKEEAYRSGIARTGETLTKSQTFLAAYNLLLKQTTDAQGAAGDASDIGVQAKQFTAEMENLKAAIGAGALPVVQKLAAGVGTLADKFLALPEPARNAVGAVGAIGTVTIGAIGGLSVIAGQLLKLKDLAGQAKSALSGFGSINISPGGFAAGTAYIALLDQIIAKGQQAQALRIGGDVDVSRPESVVAGFGKAIDDLKGKNDSFSERFAKGFMGPLGDAAGVALKAKNSMGVFNTQLDETKRLLSGMSANDATAYLNRLETAARQAGVSLTMPNGKNFVDELRRSLPALSGSVSAAGAAAAAADGLGAATDDATASIDGNTAAVEENADAQTKLSDAGRDAADAMLAVADAQRRSADARERTADAERALSDLTAKSGRNSDQYADAVRSLTSAQRSLASATESASDAHDRLRKAQSALRGEMDPTKRSLAQADANAAQVDFAAAQASLRGLDPVLDADRYRSAAQRLEDAAKRRQDALKKLSAVDPRTDPNAYARKLDDLKDAQRDANRADERVAEGRQSVADAQKRLTEALSYGVKGSKEYEAAVRDVERARRDQARAEYDAAKAQQEAVASLAAMPSQGKDALAFLDQLYQKGLLTKGAFTELATAVFGVAAGLSAMAATQQALAVGGTVGGLSMTDRYRSNESGPQAGGANFARRALGGPVSGGGLYRVGERGPELFRAGGRNFLLPGQSGSVEPSLRSVGGGDLTAAIAAAVTAATSKSQEVTVKNYGVRDATATTAATLRGLRKADFLTGVGPR